MIFYGWRIVAGAFVVLFTAYGVQYCFGVFFTALLDEFGWSRAGLAGVFSLYALLYCTVGFPAGRLTDRWGPRAVITTGGVFLGGAMAAMSLVTQLWQPYLIYGVLAAIGMGTAYVPCNSTVVRWFAARRGLAMGLANTGAGAGTLVLPPLAQLAVNGLGWRGAYMVFGLGALVTLSAAAPLMRRDPESLGLHPDGAPSPPPTARDGAPSLALGAAMRTGPFWLLASAFTATWMPVFIPLVHLVPFARDLGHSAETGAWLVSALGAGAVSGRLAMGPVSDRLGRRLTLVIAMGLQATGFVGLSTAHGFVGLAGTAFVYGYSYGAITTLFPAIIGDFFGRDEAGSLVGFLFMLSGSMAAGGPVAAGAIYDATGGYGLVFRLAAGTNVLAALLLTLARPPRRRRAV